MVKTESKIKKADCLQQTKQETAKPEKKKKKKKRITL